MKYAYKKGNLSSIVIVVVLMFAAHFNYANASQTGQLALGEQNTIVMQGHKRFAAGAFRESALDDSGNITLSRSKGNMAAAGMYISPVITSRPFTELVMSWNADTPVGTAVSVEAQAQVDGTWSPWFSWGSWNSWGQAGSKSDNSSFAKMDIDTLVIKDGKFATAFRYRVQLKSNCKNVTPAVKLLAATVNASPIKPAALLAKQDIVLAVPSYAQRERDPQIAGKICSPISITALINYYGITVLPEETAWNVMDSSQDKFMFGNWPFNCAYAGTFGLKAYVAYYNSLDDIRRDVMAGRPVAACVMYKNSEEVPDNLPILHNAPVEATDGHLVVVRGFVQQAGQEYVVVNDSAAREATTVKRLYLAEEFEKAWTKLVYVVQKDSKAVITQPNWIKAKLIQGKDTTKLSLKCGGRVIDVAAKDIGSIIKLRDNQIVEFIPPEAAGAVFYKQETGCLIVIITKSHQQYQINTD